MNTYFIKINKINDLKISLVIPCIPRDFNSNNLNNTLYSILISTILPDETIIVLSGTNDINIENIKCFYNKWNPKFKNFKLLKYPRIQSSGKNRNIGNNEAIYEVIIHADADDLYHPQRIEILKYFFENTDTMAINHLFIPLSYKFKNYNLRNIELACSKDKLYNYYFPDNKWKEFTKNEYYGSFLDMTTTDGHMAFRREVLNKVNLSDKNCLCESEFLHKICFYYKKSIFLKACLSKYSKGDDWITNFPEQMKVMLKRSI